MSRRILSPLIRPAAILPHKNKTAPGINPERLCVTSINGNNNTKQPVYNGDIEKFVNNFFKYIVLYIVRKCKYNIMPSYREKDKNTWYCQFYYRDSSGTRKHKVKRGFKYKRDADSWERNFLDSLKTTPDILFSTLAADYLDHKQRNCKPVTFRTCESRVRVWLVPYFGDKPIDSITPLGLRQVWQVPSGCSQGLQISVKALVLGANSLLPVLQSSLSAPLFVLSTTASYHIENLSTSL